jgi:hypothetical protein
MSTSWLSAQVASAQADGKNFADKFASSRDDADDIIEKAFPVTLPKRIVAVDHFDLTMIDTPKEGARLLIRPLSRMEAFEIVQASGAHVMTINSRNQATIERELQIETSSIPKVDAHTALLVMTFVRYNDVRWHLVTFESDGDGVVP